MVFYQSHFENIKEKGSVLNDTYPLFHDASNRANEKSKS